jgi:xylan 1,4-beta-xylosidase
MLNMVPEQHGWERFGQDHCACWGPGRPSPSYMEGAWMTKVRGRYYLQYGAPGSEFNAYANGTYVSDKPLGPFTYAPCQSGDLPARGLCGRRRPWLHLRRQSRQLVEHRHVLGRAQLGHGTADRHVPGEILRDGQFNASTRFGDFPHWCPTSKFDDPASLFTGWMLLSYRKPVTPRRRWANMPPAAPATRIRAPSGSPPAKTPARR